MLGAELKGGLNRDTRGRSMAVHRECGRGAPLQRAGAGQRWERRWCLRAWQHRRGAGAVQWGGQCGSGCRAGVREGVGEGIRVQGSGEGRRVRRVSGVCGRVQGGTRGVEVNGVQGVCGGRGAGQG